MTEYELEMYCQSHSHCDCKCVTCPAFISYKRGDLGLDEEEDEE